LRALWARQRGRCALTGLLIEGRPHLDHRTPVSAGGGHAVDNLQWVHPMANLAKSDRTAEEFQEWLLAAADSLRAKRELEALL
jgi:5-methylcytosine-specific restriction endonuclease McrA